MGLLERGEVDLVGTDLVSNWIRNTAVDFSIPLGEVSFRIMISTPGSSFEWVPYVGVLSADTWIAYLAAVALCSAVAATLLHISPAQVNCTSLM